MGGLLQAVGLRGNRGDACGTTASAWRSEIYLRLTDLGLSGYALLRSVSAMARPTPLSSRNNGDASQRRRRSDNIGAAGSDLGVRPGESDSTPMVGGVLLLVLATIIIVLMLVWWLA